MLITYTLLWKLSDVQSCIDFTGMKKNRLFILIVCALYVTTLLSQQKFIDPATKHKLDSLDNRVLELNQKVRDFGPDRDARFFYTKRELDMTIFLREYEELVFDENLKQAQRLIESRIKTSTKRSDTYAVQYYTDYKSRLTKLRSQKIGHYNQLFAKEKNFYKEYRKYIEPGDEHAYNKTLRMLELAIKYADRKGLQETLKYLKRYENYTHALLIDYHSNYDLKKITSAESHFLKVFEEFTDTDSLQSIQEGQKLVETCYNYSAAALSKLDSNYFAMQKIVAANAIADWNERQGISSELASLTGQAVVARRDSINKEGIYQWNDLILVIGSVNFDSKSANVRKGEAIIDADRTLINYLRVNKLSRTKKGLELGKTYILPVKDRDKVSYFRFDDNKQAWQYIVAYTHVVNPKFTREMGRFLPPLQFQDGISSQAQ